MSMYPHASAMIKRNALFTIFIIQTPRLPRTKQTQLRNKTQLLKIKHKIQHSRMKLLKIRANNQIKQITAAKIKLNNKIKHTTLARTGTKAATTHFCMRETIIQTHHQ